MKVSTATLRRARLVGSKLLVVLSAVTMLVTAWGGTKAEAGLTPASSQNSANCPKETPLTPGRRARDSAIAAVRESLRTGPEEWRTYTMQSAYPASSGEGFGAIVYNWCGPVVGSRTWVIEMHFPKLEPSASLSQGQLSSAGSDRAGACGTGITNAPVRSFIISRLRARCITRNSGDVSWCR
jgi:hypothetical protein